MGADRASVAEAPADRAAPDGRSAECPWRFLPNDCPPLSTVPRYFYDWRDGGLLRTINNHLMMAVRDLEGREASPTAGVIDSQSVETTESGGVCGYGAGKKIKDRKRSEPPLPGVSNHQFYKYPFISIT